MSFILEEDTSFTKSDEEVVRECLERTAPDVFGGRCAIAQLQRSRFRPSTSYDTYLVTIRSSRGGDVRVFLKDFGYSLARRTTRSHCA